MLDAEIILKCARGVVAEGLMPDKKENWTREGRGQSRVSMEARQRLWGRSAEGAPLPPKILQVTKPRGPLESTNRSAKLKERSQTKPLGEPGFPRSRIYHPGFFGFHGQLHARRESICCHPSWRD